MHYKTCQAHTDRKTKANLLRYWKVENQVLGFFSFKTVYATVSSWKLKWSFMSLTSSIAHIVLSTPFFFLSNVIATSSLLYHCIALHCIACMKMNFPVLSFIHPSILHSTYSWAMHVSDLTSKLNWAIAEHRYACTSTSNMPQSHTPRVLLPHRRQYTSMIAMCNSCLLYRCIQSNYNVAIYKPNTLLHIFITHTVDIEFVNRKMECKMHHKSCVHMNVIGGVAAEIRTIHAHTHSTFSFVRYWIQ